MRVGIIGVGSIGSVLADGFASLGHEVVINDRDDGRVQALEYEAKPKAWMAEHCDLAVFAVPTPTTDEGGDASAVESALEPFKGGSATCMIRSTMPPGETERLAEKTGLPLVYSPEFLRDRSGVDDFFHPDRIVLSGPPDGRKTAREALEHERVNCDTIIETRDYLTAEIGKEGHNAFFATKVSFANQIRHICEQEGADPQLAMDIITADSRNTESHLDPMLGPYGGKCLPKDTRALWMFGNRAEAATPLLKGTMAMNEIANIEFENIDIEGAYPNIQTADD
jgi:UDPglucose 6-dehydrogenase